MKTAQPPFKISRIGLSDPDDQVRQAIASVTLSGLKPTERAVELVRAVATGKMTRETALNEMRDWYKSYTN